MRDQNPTWISEWKPEDEAFWNATGKTVARRNLIWSIVAEHIGFLVSLIWSIVAVTMFGGRNWTIFSASVLFIPTFALAYFVSHPETPFWLMLCVAATAGLGGGNFASSMANISFFYPDRMKGWALGQNAAGGNIGVSGV